MDWRTFFYLRLRQMEDTLNQLWYFFKFQCKIKIYMFEYRCLNHQSTVGDFITNKLVSDITPKNIDEQN